MTSRGRVSVFDDRTIAELVRRYGKLPEGARPSVYDVGTEARHRALRDWLDAQVNMLSADDSRGMTARLRDEEKHSAAVAELAAASILRSAGYVVELERGFETASGPRTPDFVATDAVTGAIVLMGDVWTRTVSKETVVSQRRWAELGAAAASITAPVVIRVDVTEAGPARPPGASQRKRIIRHLLSWLSSDRYPGEYTECETLRFYVFGGSGGTSARMVPVTSYTSLDRGHIVETVERKTARYARLAGQLDAPMLVVLAGEAQTGLDEKFVADVLGGSNTVTMTFGANTIGEMQGRQVQLRQTDARPRFPDALSGVALLEVRGGHDARFVVWPVNTGVRPLPAFAGSGVRWST